MLGLDIYTIKARLFPAILAIAPVIALAFVMIAASWQGFGFPQALLTGSLAALFYGFADLARRRGRVAERRLFLSSGGRPFPTVLRHSDPVLDDRSKAYYHAYLGVQIGDEAPSRLFEQENPALADEYYIRAGRWLLGQTRDQLTFKVLFAENIAYGFRRNLYGLKWPGMFLNLTVIIVCSWLLIYNNNYDISQYGLVYFVSILHALYFIFAVSKQSVIDASEQFGRQLVMSIDTIKKK